jgi:hypothetical protein
MSVNGVSNSLPDPADQRLFQEINRRDPRFGGGGFGGGGAGQSAAPPETPQTPAAPPLGTDRLRFKGEPPTNPFEVLLRNRRRSKKKQDGDPTTL